MSYINSCTCVFIKIFITAIKWITNKDLLNSTGNSVLCNNLNGKRIWTRIDTCIWITESLCCMVVVYSLSRVQILATPWTVACQTSLSVGFPRQEYWSGLPFPSPGDLPHPGGLNPCLLHCTWSPACMVGRFCTAEAPERS